MRQLSMLSALFALASVTGCYVEVEDPSVRLHKPCDGSAECTFRGIPDQLQELVPLELATGSTEFEIDLGNQDLLQSGTELGPLTLESTLSINEIVVAGLDGVSLAGIEHVQISRVDAVGCGTACEAHVIARFDRSDAGADASRIVLVGNPEYNVLAQGTTIIVRVEASGRLPAVDWMADFVFDANLQARVD